MIYFAAFDLKYVENTTFKKNLAMYSYIWDSLNIFRMRKVCVTLSTVGAVVREATLLPEPRPLYP